jgi:predicted nucleic acid-binding protein
LIIDASVAFKWLVAEEDSERARDWISRTELIAPTLIHAEVGNAIWKRIGRGELAAAAAEVAEQLGKLASIIRTIDETPMLPRAVEMAIELQHPVYDCVYLAVAEAMQDELLTANARFARALVGTELGEKVRGL